MAYTPYIIPGKFEIYCGPMYSGKTQALTARLMPLEHMNCDFIFIRPTSDKRKERQLSYETFFVDDETPEKILGIVSNKHQLVAIDEIEFFNEGIVKVVKELLMQGKNVVASGLDLNFRGEPFGSMADLMAIADELTKCQRAICKYAGCGSIANRTQKLIDGKPAPHESQTKSVEGIRTNETYEPRCLKHHFVPNVKE
jgi:thymidine kinase